MSMPKITRLPPEDYRDGVFERGYVVEEGTNIRYAVDSGDKTYMLKLARMHSTGVWPKSVKDVTGINVHFVLGPNGIAYKLVVTL